MGKKVIIVCEKCSTTYEVADTAIPEQGRIVRCANCSHQWLQKKPIIPEAIELAAAPMAVEVTPSTQDSVIKQPSPPVIPPTPIMLKVAPLMLLFFLVSGTIIFYSDKIIKYLPASEKIYLSQHVFDTKDMVIADVVLQKHPEENTNNANLSIKITNYSKVSKHLPLIKIVIKDKAGKIITNHIIEQSDMLLAAAESHTSSSTIFNLSAAEELMNVHIGNRLELMFSD
jgi:predicted Zn finger-like uncharacterized protein